MEALQIQYVLKADDTSETIIGFQKDGNFLETDSAVLLEVNPDSYQSLMTTFQLLGSDLGDILCECFRINLTMLGVT